MRKIILFLLVFTMIICFGSLPVYAENDIVEIELNNENTLVDGNTITTDTDSDVYLAYDIIYYPEGKDETFGNANDEDDVHSKEEADKNAVIHIAKAGTYKLSGNLFGQIAIDLGENARRDENAVVTLILNNVDIECSVAPAICVYQVYECGSYDSSTPNVSTENAGFNIVLADNSLNDISGSHIMGIFKPGSVTFFENGKVESATLLHRYTGAIHSQMSMNITSSIQNPGKLNISGTSDCISARHHITIDGGIYSLNAQDNGIFTYGHGASVFTLNNGQIVSTSKSEQTYNTAYGIRSEGWFVINNGYLMTIGNTANNDAGLWVNNELIVNDGIVIASGTLPENVKTNMNSVSFNFDDIVQKDTLIRLSKDNVDIFNVKILGPINKLSYIGSNLTKGKYQLSINDVLFSDSKDVDVSIKDGHTNVDNVNKYIPPDYTTAIIITVIVIGSIFIAIVVFFVVKFVIKRLKIRKEKIEAAKKEERRRKLRNKKKHKKKKR